MPDINYSIRLVNEEGEGISDRRVGVATATTYDSGITDQDGWVSFYHETMLYSQLGVKVYSEGELLGEVTVEDGDTFSFTVVY